MQLNLDPDSRVIGLPQPEVDGSWSRSTGRQGAGASAAPPAAPGSGTEGVAGAVVSGLWAAGGVVAAGGAAVAGASPVRGAVAGSTGVPVAAPLSGVAAVVPSAGEGRGLLGRRRSHALEGQAARRPGAPAPARPHRSRPGRPGRPAPSPRRSTSRAACSPPRRPARTVVQVATRPRSPSVLTWSRRRRRAGGAVPATRAPARANGSVRAAGPSGPRGHARWAAGRGVGRPCSTVPSAATGTRPASVTAMAAGTCSTTRIFSPCGKSVVSLQRRAPPGSPPRPGRAGPGARAAWSSSWRSPPGRHARAGRPRWSGPSRSRRSTLTSEESRSQKR